MTLELAHLISLSVFYGMIPVLVIASFVLADDLALRQCVMAGLLTEALLAAIVERPLVSLGMVFLFMHQFLRYIKLVERVTFNRQSARKIEEAMVRKLGEAAQHIGGSMLGTDEFIRDYGRQRGGRHRYAA